MENRAQGKLKISIEVTYGKFEIIAAIYQLCEKKELITMENIEKVLKEKAEYQYYDIQDCMNENLTDWVFKQECEPDLKEKALDLYNRLMREEG